MRERISEEVIADPQVWSYADVLYAAYRRGDITFSLEQVQAATITAAIASRKMNTLGTGYVADSPQVAERLRQLDIDPNTLLPKQS